MSGHAEGPFRVIEFRGSPFIAGPAWTAKDPYSHRVAEMVCWSNGLRPTRDEARAIAHLFVAAPALRDALENLIIAIGMGWDLEGVVEQGKAAIAAAEPKP